MNGYHVSGSILQELNESQNNLIVQMKDTKIQTAKKNCIRLRLDQLLRVAMPLAVDFNSLTHLFIIKTPCFWL